MKNYLKFEKNGENFYVKRKFSLLDRVCAFVYHKKSDNQLIIYKEISLFRFKLKIEETSFSVYDLSETYNLDKYSETFYVDCANTALNEYFLCKKEKEKEKKLEQKQEKFFEKYCNSDIKF